MEITRFFLIFAFMVAFVLIAGPVLAAEKPNILVIWGDDIGRSNLSPNTEGMTGYRTPNIDRVANEGMKYTDCYAD